MSDTPLPFEDEQMPLSEADQRQAVVAVERFLGLDTAPGSEAPAPPSSIPATLSPGPKGSRHDEVDPVVETKNGRSFALSRPALVTVTRPLVAALGGLLLLTAGGCGTSLGPGETEAGSAGEQPAEG